MAIDRRRKNVEWNVIDENNCWYSGCKYGGASLAVLMDIRDELKQLNSLLACPNFIGIPRTLRAIHRKMPTRKKVK